MDRSDCEHYAPTTGFELVKGVLSHASAAGTNKDHVVAAVDVRRVYFCAEPLQKTFVRTARLLRSRHPGQDAAEDL